MDFDDKSEGLVRSAQEGKSGAFRTLYEIYHQRVFRTAVRLLGDRVSAEDIVQEVFITLYERLGDFDFRSSFSTWVYRITVNACYAVIRKRDRRGRYHERDLTIEELMPSSAVAIPDSAMKRREVERYLEEAMSRLSSDLRATFVLRQMEGLSYEEIGQVLDVSTGTVASRLARAREQLAETLRGLGIDEAYFN